MAVNPYAAPRAPLQDENETGFRFSIALIGMLIGTGAAYVVGILFSNIVQWALLGQGVPLNALYNTIAGSISYNAGGHVINVVAAALGGYWASKLGPQRKSAHAMAAGALMVIPVAIAWLVPYQLSYPAWSIALSFLTPIPSAYMGGLCWSRRN